VTHRVFLIRFNVFKIINKKKERKKERKKETNKQTHTHTHQNSYNTHTFLRLMSITFVWNSVSVTNILSVTHQMLTEMHVDVPNEVDNFVDCFEENCNELTKHISQKFVQHF
jgi:ABC-type Zn2+ transport system substrate-binding protein/surface adhesin